MDPNTARAVLRLDPAAPLAREAVEQAHRREAWEWHPSRYPDAEGRASAEAWAATLDEARGVLLAALPTMTDAAAPAATRRGLSRGAVIGIVAGSVALLAVLATAGVGAARLATTAIEQSRIAEAGADRAAGDGAGAGQAAADDDAPGDASAESGGESLGVERIEADETYFTFPAALELYDDGRYGHLCGLEHLEGCWESAVFVEQDCANLEIELGFSNDDDVWAPAEETRTVTESDVIAGEALPVVFGNDGFDFGWMQDVRCTTAAS
ncbi:hypothetical protein [Agromyces sp. ZXT2-6]|uniref:hypothetical protein n=1 Tax=Agromyces sp. ZXT2-6 TaxID=3461153 RepID=UPI00405520FA